LRHPIKLSIKAQPLEADNGLIRVLAKGAMWMRTIRLIRYLCYRAVVKTAVAAPLVLLLLAVSARATIFSSSMAEAEWQVNASVFECSLTHPVPAFGSAVFARRAGEPEVFRLQQKKRLLPEGTAELQAALPPWRSDYHVALLASVTVAASNNEAVRLDAARAREMQAELDAGRRLIFVAPSAQPEQSSVRVILEPVRFRGSLKDYRDCLTRLLPVNFDQAERTSIYFAEQNDTLSAVELRKLDVLIRYVKADRSVKQIVIDGHTDSVGIRPENLEVSKARAEMIANYLIERGIPAGNLLTRWHGERYPIVSNQTPAGRVQNRRVTLRLERSKP
jgi:outer membrane protein OmpA-like peptidoglycan-associated protein